MTDGRKSLYEARTRAFRPTLPERHVRTRTGQQAASTWGAGTTIAPGEWRPDKEPLEERNVEKSGGVVHPCRA